MDDDEIPELSDETIQDEPNPSDPSYVDLNELSWELAEAPADDNAEVIGTVEDPHGILRLLPRDLETHLLGFLNQTRTLRRILGRRVDNEPEDTERLSDDELYLETVTRDGISQSYTADEGPTTFDTNLPSEHLYLGNDLQSLSGHTVYDDNQTTSLFVVFHDVLVCPGHTFPLTVDHSRPLFFALNGILEGDKTFGLVWLGTDKHGKNHNIGVTMEIYEYNDENNVVKIKARARQRFQLIDKHTTARMARYENVRIFPEIQLTPVLSYVETRSISRNRRCVDIAKYGEQTGQSYDFDELIKHNNKLKQAASIQTIWPAFVYNMYDETVLVNDIRKFLSTLYGNVPYDPSELSYWIVQNHPIPDHERIEFLKMNNPVQRLRCIFKCIATGFDIICRRCHAVIADESALFSMSKRGSNYCNPDGYIHELITIRNARRYKGAEQAPSERFSWFPGYAWRTISCSNCWAHIGWIFTKVQYELKPSFFIGLTKRQMEVRPKTEKSG